MVTERLADWYSRVVRYRSSRNLFTVANASDGLNVTGLLVVTMLILTSESFVNPILEPVDSL